MKKLGILGAALCAVFAFVAFAASSAFAVEPQWLVDGVAVTANTPSETEGEVTLLSETGANSSIELQSIDCSGYFVGVIGPKGTDEVTEVQNLAEEKVGAVLVQPALLCNVLNDTSFEDCETGLTAAEVWPIHLPWKTQLELMADGSVLDIFTGTGGNPGWYARCKTLLGVTVENECEAPNASSTTTLLTNGTGEVLGKFEPVAQAERGNCTLTGEHSAEVTSPTAGQTWAYETRLTGRLTTAISDL